jgi:hypothetical protein
MLPVFLQADRWMLVALGVLALPAIPLQLLRPSEG